MSSDNCANLKNLDLSDNRLGEIGAIDLFEMIEKNTF